MIDWQRVATLRDEVGAEDFGEVVDIFLEEVDEVIDRLKDKPDATTLEADLHFLKGGAQGLGFKAFSDLCQTGETLCAKDAAQDVDVVTILDTYSKSRQLFMEELPTALAS